MNILKTPLNLLRDPIWTAIGSLATLVTLFFVFAPPAPNGELSVVPCCDAISIGGEWLPTEKFQLNIKDKGRLASDLKIYTRQI